MLAGESGVDVSGDGGSGSLCCGGGDGGGGSGSAGGGDGMVVAAVLVEVVVVSEMGVKNEMRQDQSFMKQVTYNLGISLPLFL